MRKVTRVISKFIPKNPYDFTKIDIRFIIHTLKPITEQCRYDATMLMGGVTG